MRDGKAVLSAHSVARTFGNIVKGKFLSTVTVKDGDVVSFIFVGEGPRFTFTTDVSNSSSSNFCNAVNW